jgi:hypothetical protein
MRWLSMIPYVLLLLVQSVVYAVAAVLAVAVMFVVIGLLWARDGMRSK